MSKIHTLVQQMNLFEVFFFDVVIFSVGVLLGNLLSPVLTNSLYVFFTIAVVGCAYFISYFFVSTKPITKTPVKTAAKKTSRRR